MAEENSNHTPISLTEATPLGEVIKYVIQHRDEGLCCPACGQMAKVYLRRLNSGIAVSLFKMLKAAGQEWQHIPTTVGGRSREEAKARYWGLVEESDTKREDGGGAGYWRLTQKGEDFLRGRISIQKYAQIYNGGLLGFEGEQVWIRDCLGNKFDYNELMMGIPQYPAENQ